jgi:rRNA maturation protein Nop10
MIMSLHTCAACSTRYAADLAACPHCGSSDVDTEYGTMKRLPMFVTVSCVCGRGPWHLRMSQVMPGLIQLPTLFCASCGSQVQVPWPPVEDDMSPKITVHGGATNARETEPSPAVDASQPLVGAEADQGHSTPVVVAEPEPEAEVEPVVEDEAPVKEAEVDPYAGMTLAELREAADARGIPSYGSKAQITDRLRAADGTV